MTNANSFFCPTPGKTRDSDTGRRRGGREGGDGESRKAENPMAEVNLPRGNGATA